MQLSVYFKAQDISVSIHTEYALLRSVPVAFTYILNIGS